MKTKHISAKDGTIVILFVGSHFVVKGGKEVLDAFDKLNKEYKIELNIISQVPAYFNLYKEYKNVHIYNYVEREKVLKEFYPKTDIFILPTHYDTWGMALLEAMSFGIPVLSTNLFAVPEIVEHGKTGLLSPKPKVSWFDDKYQLNYNGKHEDIWKQFNEELMSTYDKELVDSLVENAKLLIENPDLRQRMGIEAKKVIAEKFSIQRRNKQLRRIYAEAMK